MNYNDIEPFVGFVRRDKIVLAQATHKTNLNIFCDATLSIIRKVRSDHHQRVFFVGKNPDLNIITSVATLDRLGRINYSIATHAILRSNHKIPEIEHCAKCNYFRQNIATKVDEFILNLYDESNGDFETLYNALWLHML